MSYTFFFFGPKLHSVKKQTKFYRGTLLQTGRTPFAGSEEALKSYLKNCKWNSIWLTDVSHT